jgi:hypothetical protein
MAADAAASAANKEPRENRTFEIIKEMKVL